ncbi:hypothetical protein QQ045_027784 [Rhodiola kirilowii]
MAVPEQESPAESGKVWNLFKLPFRHSSSASSSQNQHPQQLGLSDRRGEGSNQQNRNSVGFVARSLLPTRRRLRLDPANKLYFPYEPGKQVRSAIKIKNTCKSHVAFKFQTTAPKSCFMRPPGAILAPGESIIATVFKFVEHPENNAKLADLRSRVKFKIMSLKVTNVLDYAPELVSYKKSGMLHHGLLLKITGH